MSLPTATPTSELTASARRFTSAARRSGWRRHRLARAAAPLSLAVPGCIVAVAVTGFHSGFPSTWLIGVPHWFDSLNNWVTNNSSSNFFLHTIVGGFGNFLNDATNWVVDLLHWLTWVGVLAISTVVAWLVGSWRTAVFSAAVVASFGVLQIPNGGVNGISEMWPSAMTTLALMAVAIVLSTVVGIPLGIACGVWPRVSTVLRPVLDLMQIMPAFAYLVPIVVLFSIGNPAGIVATFIYAVPPLVRFTEIGIRSVRRDVVEAAEAFGSTRWQILRNVQLPLAAQAIMLGLNQVIMMALSIVVIASLIGAGGLGDPVLSALQTQQIGEGFVAGILIVFMAMWLDRTSAAFGQRAAHDRSASQRRLSRRQLAAVGGAALTLVLISRYGVGTGDWPSGWGFSIVDQATTALNWITDEFTGISDPTSSFLTLQILNPLQNYLTDVPWWLVTAIVGTVGWMRGGWRRGILLAGCVVLLGLLQAPAGYTFQGTTSYDFVAWNSAMETLSLVIVALALDLIVGIPLGIAAYRSRTFDRILRPILDFLQTLPAFVYLIPVVTLFGVGNVAGVSASFIYALPAAVRATTLGLRAVQRDVIEAGQAFGSTRWQLLFKVELPIARPYLMLAVNQTILLVMAEVVVAGLVGAGGLGLDVVTGFSRSEVGLGATAGLAMVLMGIVLDRLSQSSPDRGRMATS
ncbi:MAG TPA: ABC transporter permease subunit [Gaiellaceae bacterium]|nr:ABC transporter permease subunit [Gaiellaceae bacterium]